jgi:hypothetical protein
MMAHRNRLTFASALLVLLISVGQGRAEEVAGPPLPPDPVLENGTLEGVDSDADGIRDDVQRYIAVTYSSCARTRAALTQLARAVQSALLGADSREASLAHMEQLVRATECLFSIMPDDAEEVKERLIAKIVDTETRGRAYLEFESHLGGEVFSSNELEHWPESCEVGRP